MTATRTPFLFFALLVSASGLAQAPSNGSAPVSYSSITELNQLIGNLQQASQSAQEDLSHLRVEKWKTDGGTKRQTDSDIQSILRNLQNALPGMLSDLKNAPESLPQTFKVYRNLDALCDVMNSVVESAGAFGNKEEFQSLSKDLESVQGSRRGFAERMDKLSNAKETEISQLRAELQNARAALPPKKTVVDDTEAPKKTTPKKKPAAKPKPAQPQTQAPVPQQ